MAEHLHDDRFDEFLKNSLDNYSESPPDAVWNGIEEAFPMRSLPLWRRYWWVGAVLILFMGALVYQHLHYRQQLDKLELKLQMKAEQAVASSQSPNPSVNAVTESERDADMTMKGAGLTLDKSVQQSTHKLSGRSLAGELNEERTASQMPSTGVTRDEPQQHGGGAGHEVAQSETSATGLEEASDEEAVDGIPEAIATLPLLLNAGESALQLKLPSQHPMPTTELWAGPTIGVYSSVRDFKNSSGEHHHGGGPHSEFEEQSAASGNVVSSGCLIEKELVRGLSLRSGLQYTVYQYASSHAPSFKLGESMPGMHGFDHDFQYALYTPTGSATLTLRVEQVDTTVQVSPDENIGLTVGTREKFRYLSVPVGFSWHARKGRIGLGLSTSLIGNILIDSEMRISSVEVQNPVFEAHHDGNSSAATIDATAPFYLEMAATASVNIHFHPAFRLELGPAFRFQLTDPDANSNSSSKGFAGGFQTALMYRF